MSVASQLYRLQLIDTEIAEKEQQLEEVTQRLGVSDQVIQARATIDEADKVLVQTRSQMRALDLEIGGLTDRLKANEERATRGKGLGARESKGLEDEANSLRRRRSELEDRQLELMFAVEDQEKDKADRQAQLRQVELSWQEEQAVTAAEKEQLEARLAELQELRAAIRARVPKVDLVQYDELRDSLGGIAVALLKRGICQVCGVDVPTREALAVQRGEGVHFCPVCNRMLYGGV